MIRLAFVLVITISVLTSSGSSVGQEKKIGIPDVTPESDVRELIEASKQVSSSALITTVQLIVPIAADTHQSHASLNSKQLRDYIEVFLTRTPSSRERLRLSVREPSLGKILMSDPLRRIKDSRLPANERQYVSDYTEAYTLALVAIEDDLNELLRQSTAVLLEPGMKLPPHITEELRKLRDNQILALSTDSQLKNIPQQVADASNRVRTADISGKELQDLLGAIAQRNRLLEVLKRSPYSETIRELDLKQDDVAAIFQHTLQAYTHLRLTYALDAALRANLSQRIEDEKIQIPEFVRQQSSHKARVLAVYRWSDPKLTDADMIEIEFGEGGPSPTRLYLPKTLVPAAVLSAIREGEFPIVGTERYFNRLFWVLHAHWQILARERGYGGFKMGWYPNEYRQFGPP